MRVPYSLAGETYYSADPAVIRQQIEWAAAYGVDAFSLEWMTPRGIPGSLEDNIDDAFLQAPNLFKIRWCIFYDFVLRLLQTPGLDVDISQSLDFDNPEIFNIFVSDFAHFASKYFGHPQYLAIDGRPVVYIWATNACTGNLAGAMQAARAAAATYGFDVYVVGEEVMANAFDGAHASQFDANTTFTFLIPGADASWADVGEAAVSVDGIFQNWRDWIQGLKVAGRDDPVVFQPVWAPQFDDRLFRDGFPEGGDPIYVPAMNRQQVVAMAETARRHARPAGASGMKLVWLNTFNGWAGNHNRGADGRFRAEISGRKLRLRHARGRTGGFRARNVCFWSGRRFQCQLGTVDKSNPSSARVSGHAGLAGGRGGPDPQRGPGDQRLFLLPTRPTLPTAAATTRRSLSRSTSRRPVAGATSPLTT